MGIEEAKIWKGHARGACNVCTPAVGGGDGRPKVWGDATITCRAMIGWREGCAASVLRLWAELLPLLWARLSSPPLKHCGPRWREPKIGSFDLSLNCGSYTGCMCLIGWLIFSQFGLLHVIYYIQPCSRLPWALMIRSCCIHWFKFLYLFFMDLLDLNPESHMK